MSFAILGDRRSPTRSNRASLTGSTVDVVASSRQTLSVEERRLVAAWAADCAEHVLAIFQAAEPADARVRNAIDQARAKAAAHSAEQAAAAHMGAHALGAAGYAVKASTLAAAGGSDSVECSEVSRQVAAMNDAVARAISLLPAVGWHCAGPLGPGRLSNGHVGQAIRAIQAELKNR